MQFFLLSTATGTTERTRGRTVTQISLTQFLPNALTPAKQNAVNEELAKKIATDFQPCSVVDDKGFTRSYIHALSPREQGQKKWKHEHLFGNSMIKKKTKAAGDTVRRYPLPDATLEVRSYLEHLHILRAADPLSWRETKSSVYLRLVSHGKKIMHYDNISPFRRNLLQNRANHNREKKLDHVL